MAAKDNIAYCEVLMGLIQADDWAKDVEIAFLERVIERLGLSKADRDRVLSGLGPDDAEAAAAAIPEGDKETLLTELMGVALADAHFNEAEFLYVSRVGMAMGFDDKTMERKRRAAVRISRSR